MFFRRDGVEPSASQLPKARYSLRVEEGLPLLKLFSHALTRHPYNQQVFLVASDGSQGSTAGAQSALKAAISCVANRSCCICLRNVRLESFLHLPLQQLLLKRWQGSVLTWRGPGGAAACSGASAADGAGVSCSVVGDTGGDMNAACLQNDGIMILKLDRFTAQVLGLDTWMRLPHFMRKSLPPGTRYLKIDVQHPAVVRHQKPPRESARHSQTQSQWPDREMQTGYPPSRLYVKLQRGLSSLEPVDVLASTAPPEGDCESVEARRRMAEQLQLLLRAGGSPDATCHLVQLQCRLSDYRGGIMDMTEEAALAASTMANAHTQQEGDLLMTPDLPVTQMPSRLLLPDWDKFFAAAAVAAPKRRPLPSEHTDATVVERHRCSRKTAGHPGVRIPNQAKAQSSLSKASSRRSSSSEPLSPVSSPRQAPPLRPDFLEALQLLHERQKRRSAKSQHGSKGHQAAPESASHTEEALQLAAAPPFRKLPQAEALFTSVTEYLGCLGMDMPVNNDDCGWLRKADRRTDPQSIPVASASGGLLHSAAVVSASESLYTWLLSQRRGAWAAVTVVGVADTAAAYTGQPHGSDISGESTLHFVLYADETDSVRGALLQTISACDAATSLP
ncbi:hypothetical protein, conserved [Eimeria necatrix]|uniref:Uncharacterized protein n=1 Tax=Eimeria necatrix TaxID=51315 RepID=U6MSW8_9EIME|nr:hypothetical protein, conserved [Eimeria necatrix]CDJ67101.1 hypothetical protein, conserved [Eimeria necatrix]